MKVKKITIIFVLAGIITNSCIDTLDVNIDRNESILVFEGFITTKPSPHIIKITRSAKYASSFSSNGLIKDVKDARVLIRDQKGEVTFLSEIGFGEYVTPAGFRAVVGNSYILQVTIAGKTYFSTCRPPCEGFSWVDRRFLRDFASRLSGDAVFLYFFLAAVSDKHGLSFYGDATLAVRLRLREEAVVAARDELVIHDLAAYQAPLTQVLSLPKPRVERGYAAAVRELMRTRLDTDSPRTAGRQS